ncbi:TonB-dependent receptor [Wenzhouxiangella sp. XN201]|uniref:TonB-dependent receptor domain-containing protein n=1 Tax=Wenzhouxiangella sp. XN201 TaxID=2710755 RepID=UPI0013CCD422|nr:TonB-dependent receptor [Wenzhouxiangella sp. XN201]NEZ02878.1 TonB-dependent receptor [Wenzhouxiangella sp. XN201]
MNFRYLTGLAAAGLISVSTIVSADSWDGEPIVVTASRSPAATGDSLTRSSVIDRDAIEASQAGDLLELLRLEAGIDVARGGGPGSQTAVFMRGSNSNHVLVLIDGVRVSAAGTGAFAWENLDPAIIERVEIVRGPRAARYGSDAIGGVIQIFTRRPDGAQFRVGYGRYDDRRASAGWGTRNFGLSVAMRRFDGFSAQNENGFAFDPDDDGFDNDSLALGGELGLAGGTWSWNARASDGQVEFDQGVSDMRNYSARTEYRSALSGPWQWQASIGLHRDRLETETAFSDSETVTRRLQTGIQAERALGNNQLWLLGVDAWRESGYSADSWSGDRYNIGAWTGLEGRHNSFDWEMSLRVDEDELFGSATTGSLAGGWRPSEDWRLFARFGRAFRAPNFNQLYSPGFGGLFAGNPDLDPETAQSGELGLDWTPTDRQQFDLSLFEQRIDDLIDFSGPDFQAININRARIRGAELVHRFNAGQWHSQTSLTWQDPENRDSGDRLLRRPEEKAHTTLDYRFDNGGWAGLEVSYTGERADVGGVELEDFTLVNLRAGWPLGTGFRIEGRIDNLTDRDYEPLAGFNAPGRSLFVALSWQD